MNCKNTLQLLLLVVATQVFFACSTAKYYDFGSQPAYENQTLVKNGHIAESTLPASVISTENAVPEPQFEASAAGVVPASPLTPVNLSEKAIAPQEKPIAKPLTKTERRQVVKQLRTELKAMKKAEKENSAPAAVGTVLLVILAIILPPLAVYLVRGIGKEFWLSVLLTLLVWLPGVIYALYIIFS